MLGLESEEVAAGLSASEGKEATVEQVVSEGINSDQATYDRCQDESDEMESAEDDLVPGHHLHRTEPARATTPAAEKMSEGETTLSDNSRCEQVGVAREQPEVREVLDLDNREGHPPGSKNGRSEMSASSNSLISSRIIIKEPE